MINFCKAIIRSAVGYCAEEAQCACVVFGGDANIRLALWTTAFTSMSGWELTFEHPQFLAGIGRKGGDLMVVATRRGAVFEIFDNTCAVAGREEQRSYVFRVVMHRSCFRTSR